MTKLTSNLKNTVKSTVKASAVAGGLAAMVISSGCASIQPQTEVTANAPCPVVDSANVDSAFGQASQAMAIRHCQIQFESYFDKLLTVAAESPSIDNKKRFDGFFRQLDGDGVISKRQATELYTQYFTTSYMALPDTYNVCSAGREQDKILSAMRAELDQKKRGLMDVLGEKDLYFKARQSHDEIGLILQTAVDACST